MPARPWTRDREGVLPAKLDDWVAADHPVRFVAAFVAELSDAEWGALGTRPGGHPGGAPAYDPVVLLAAWLYGFMSGVRSCRKLAVACAEQVPFLWLTGGQRPDHNTLWRFYQRHRSGMHVLFRRTVATAATSGLVVWAIQAVDGTKIGGNAARDRTLDAAALAKLLDRVAAAIADLEAQNRPDGPPTPPRLPNELAQAERLRTRVRAALDLVTAPDGPQRLNLTDPEAGLVKGRHGVVAGYNAQAVVARVDLPGARSARLLTAVKEYFAYDGAADAFTCPAGHLLTFRGTKARTNRPVLRIYRGMAAVCRACSHFGACTKDTRQGRALEVGPHEVVLRAHRAWMATEEAQALTRQRKSVIEPVFGVLKEELGARRFLLRGRANVEAEWTLVATAANLRTCVRLWQHDRLAA